VSERWTFLEHQKKECTGLTRLVVELYVSNRKTKALGQICYVVFVGHPETCKKWLSIQCNEYNE